MSAWVFWWETEWRSEVVECCKQKQNKPKKEKKKKEKKKRKKEKKIKRKKGQKMYPDPRPFCKSAELDVCVSRR